MRDDVVRAVAPPAARPLPPAAPRRRADRDPLALLPPPRRRCDPSPVLPPRSPLARRRPVRAANMAEVRKRRRVGGLPGNLLRGAAAGRSVPQVSCGAGGRRAGYRDTAPPPQPRRPHPLPSGAYCPGKRSLAPGRRARLGGGARAVLERGPDGRAGDREATGGWHREVVAARQGSVPCGGPGSQGFTGSSTLGGCSRGALGLSGAGALLLSGEGRGEGSGAGPAPSLGRGSSSGGRKRGGTGERNPFGVERDALRASSYRLSLPARKNCFSQALIGALLLEDKTSIYFL